MSKPKTAKRKRPKGTCVLYASISSDAYALLVETVAAEVAQRRAGDRRPTMASVVERCVMQVLAPDSVGGFAVSGGKR